LSSFPLFSSTFLHHLPILHPLSPPSPPHIFHCAPRAYAPIASTPLFPRSGSISSPPNRTAGQCATYSDHVPTTCPTRPCSSSTYHPRNQGAVYGCRNPRLPYYLRKFAIRKRSELFVTISSLRHISFRLDQPSPTPYSLGSFLYTHQGVRRWLLWYSLALRLAWAATPQYTHVDNAVRRRYPTGVCEYASRRRQAYEKKVGRRLGRV